VTRVRARDLKPGDIIREGRYRRRFTVTYVRTHTVSGDGEFPDFEMTTVEVKGGRTAWAEYRPDDLIEVVS
jgi:hypothetical protein